MNNIITLQRLNIHKFDQKIDQKSDPLTNLTFKYLIVINQLLKVIATFNNWEILFPNRDLVDENILYIDPCLYYEELIRKLRFRKKILIKNSRVL